MKIQGQIDLPGDKSISHRALMIASLAAKTSTIRNLASGKDVKSTENCLKKCNIGIILLVLGLFILAISLFIPINFFVSMITGLTLMLISLVRFIKNICSECGIVIDDNDIPSCPGCGVDFN